MNPKIDLPIQKNALEVLRKNIYQTSVKQKTYSYILPSKEFYMHQWFWDSCMHAMGLVYDNPQQAFKEIESLLGGQWKNGHIGHITFSHDDNTYFPGPTWWATEEFSQNGRLSSGIIQPPLLAVSINHIDTVLREKGEDTSWVDGVLDNIIQYHMYLKKHRDNENSGLITIIHPWESGTDNSPRWDNVLSTIQISSIPKRIFREVHTNRTDNKLGKSQDRPRTDDYYRYLYLVDLYKTRKWDTQEILKTTPFAVKDTLVNAIWAKANKALSELLQKRGKRKEAEVFALWASQTTEALQKSWNPKEKMYALYDVSFGQKKAYCEDTIANFLPLYAGAATREQRNILMQHLTNPNKYWTKYAVPSTSLDNPSFENSRYWRGPSWPITNLFLIEGLHLYGASYCAARILEKTLGMIEDFGFFEYYNPEGKEKKGIGFGKFSWSAAIYLYLSKKYSQQAKD